MEAPGIQDELLYQCQAASADVPGVSRMLQTPIFIPGMNTENSFTFLQPHTSSRINSLALALQKSMGNVMANFICGALPQTQQADEKAKRG